MKKSDSLRERAEKYIQNAKVKGNTPESTADLVHELHVHQTELEIQNEELRDAQEELSELYNQYRELYDEAPVGYFSLDDIGNIRNVNIKGAELLGLEKNMIIGFGFIRFIPINCQTKYYNSLKAAVVNRKIQEVELQLKRKKSLFYVQMQIMQIHNKPDEKYRIIITDITERKKSEEELRQSHDNLELKVQERTAELDILIDELKRSNEELQQFAYVASHDLQEPLRTIASFTQLLERRYKDNLDSDADEFMDYILEAVKRMQQLINDLLEYSRVTSKENEFEPADINEVLNTAISNLKISIDENDVEIIYENLPTIMADKLQLVQLFQNLIGNAIKFRKHEEPLKIHISARKEDNEYIFSVSDNGIGIEPQYTDQIFTIFQRLHTRDVYQGTGIGLSIAKKIVERHEGRIWVESSLGKSSTFYFTIPIMDKF